MDLVKLIGTIFLWKLHHCDALGMTQTFDLIRNDCGEVCDTTVSPVGKGKYYDVVEKSVECDDLFRSAFIEGWKLPEDEDGSPMPPRLSEMKEKEVEYYNYQGRINVSDLYFNGARGSWSPHGSNKDGKTVWSKRMVEDMRTLFRKGALHGNYGKASTNEIAEALRQF